ncbi:hypothetical protein JCM31826_09500 [Thermaurantimonas aggregans]|uniref:Uncharacterized protein n=1 Tax=Thermaurantimonas aggregans TaxID=2173829 RepID=A0A401XKC9_9FLAO|nr:hypothetical protein JCM31826_09500 [Thermaurantimonas aggregans]
MVLAGEVNLLGCKDEKKVLLWRGDRQQSTGRLVFLHNSIVHFFARFTKKYMGKKCVFLFENFVDI